MSRFSRMIGRGGLSVFVAGLAVWGAAACDDDKVPPVPSNNGFGSCEFEESLVCTGGQAVRCLDGGVEQREDCQTDGLVCNPDYGCVRCTPNALSCDGAQVLLCDADGRKLIEQERCTGGTQCSPRGCRDLCADALAERSYLGCEYWPTFTSNSQLDPSFRPAVVIANPNLVDAAITIEKAGAETITETVPPESSKSVYLAFDELLKGDGSPPVDPLVPQDIGGSVLVAGGAYHLRSSVPVTVHQFNPLLFEIDQECVWDRDVGTDTGRCNSYTNDASLLLPAHVLSRETDDGVSYLGVSRSSFINTISVRTLDSYEKVTSYLPGFLAITAAGTMPVNVHVRVLGHTRASADGTLPELAPGDTLDQLLMPGDVLQLRSGTSTGACPGEETTLYPDDEAREHTVCDPGADYDLTGSEIEADGPVQVIGGHDCTYVPYDTPACDHLEESLFPVETWGKQVVVTRPRTTLTPYMLRVLSSAAGNRVTFEPAVHAPVTLARGESVELELDQHVVVRGTKPLSVAQFQEGQGGGAGTGDPDLSFAIPTDQFRESYQFLTPETYTTNYINVIARNGAAVLLDGTRVDSWEAVEGGDFSVAVVEISEPGPHVLESSDGSAIGLVLYGYGAYTSYMLPGGLDLKIIAPPL